MERKNYSSKNTEKTYQRKSERIYDISKNHLSTKRKQKPTNRFRGAEDTWHFHFLCSSHINPYICTCRAKNLAGVRFLHILSFIKSQFHNNDSAFSAFILSSFRIFRLLHTRSIFTIHPYVFRNHEGRRRLKDGTPPKKV